MQFGGVGLITDENDKLFGPIGQNNDEAVIRDWVFVLESAIETLTTETKEPNPELIEELKAAIEAFNCSHG